MTFAMLVASLFIIPLGNFWVMNVTCCILGTFLVPIIPSSMGMGAELTFPLAPAMTNGILMMTG